MFAGEQRPADGMNRRPCPPSMHQMPHLLQEECCTCRRWEWQPLANVTCIPTQGHLPAGAKQAVLLTFQSDKPVQLKGQPLILRANQITAIGEGVALRRWFFPGPQPQIPEPAVQVIAGSSQDSQIKVGYVVDLPCWTSLSRLAYLQTAVEASRPLEHVSARIK